MKKLLLRGAAAAAAAAGLALNPADGFLLPHVSNLTQPFVQLPFNLAEHILILLKSRMNLILERVSIAVEVGYDCVISSSQGIFTFLILLLEFTELSFEALNQIVATSLTGLMILSLPLGHLEMLPSEEYHHDAQRTIIDKHLDHSWASHNSSLCDLGLH